MDAEASVLSRCLLDHGALDDVRNIVEPADFYADANGRIFEAILELDAMGKRPDVVLVAGLLRASGKLEQIGGTPYLAQLSDATPFAARIAEHAQVVADKSKQRQVVAACQRFAAEGYDDVGDVSAWTENATRILSGIQAQGTAGRGGSLRRLGDLLSPALERAELRRNGQERPVPLPFPQYAEILQGGYLPGVHSVVAGTGVGKSTIMFQVATHAAQSGVPVLYIGLELGEMQVALRAVAEASRGSWSRMYTGRCSEKDLDRAREAIPALANLPFYVEFGSAHGWAPSNLVTRAEQIRRAHPTGPMLVVLDFLQLVGAEAVSNDRAPELREKIAKAAYSGVHVANKYGAAVVLISSAARDKYALLAGDMKAAGITTRHVPGHVEPVRTIMNPDALIGVGKESGEIEYAAESQTVLVRWPAPLDNGEKAIICAVPKLRYGGPSWVAMSFWQRFDELPFKSTDELPEPNARAGRPSAGPSELEQRLLDTVRKNPELPTKSAVARMTKGTKGELLGLFDKLVESGKLVATEKGFVVREEPNL